jgi:hypothetical protein
MGLLSDADSTFCMNEALCGEAPIPVDRESTKYAKDTDETRCSPNC